MNAKASRPPRILFVGMHTSIHLARWIETAARTGADLHLFPVFPGVANESLRDVTLHMPRPPGPTASEPGLSLADAAAARRFRLDPVPVSLEMLGGPDVVRAGGVRFGGTAGTAPLMHGPGVLASVIHRTRPDLIHSLEFQHSGYLTLEARKIVGASFPPWLATNWGSDIYFYKRFPEHRSQIIEMLDAIDLYSCECLRDVHEARRLGYVGPVLPVTPNSGGFDLDEVARFRAREKPSQRRLIMIKGYQHFAGRAMTALAVLEKLAPRLKGHEIVLYSMSEAPYQKAKDLVAKGVLNIRMVGYASHAEMLSLFAQARIYMGISVSDAISTSVLEAMALGAFPIQTDTSCCAEWFEDGEGGFTVPPDGFDMICRRFERALDDDALVDRAADLNWEVVKRRLDAKVIATRVAELYDVAFEHVLALRSRERAGTRRRAEAWPP